MGKPDENDEFSLFLTANGANAEGNLGLMFLYNWEFFDAFLVIITGTFSFGQYFINLVQISEFGCIIGVFSGNLGI